MSERGPRRRLRIRRKRKGESFAQEAGEEVAWHMGCCLVEAVVSAGIVLALFGVPALLLVD